ncbi:hypothetical protein, partial [Pararhizobium sp. BT-229]|uniref:hypothetical protein n=1 Tax=Pararhizobium sp. BT-229 TaxID=2986923 RepID=UPI0021F71735
IAEIDGDLLRLAGLVSEFVNIIAHRLLHLCGWYVDGTRMIYKGVRRNEQSDGHPGVWEIIALSPKGGTAMSLFDQLIGDTLIGMMRRVPCNECSRSSE